MDTIVFFYRKVSVLKNVRLLTYTVKDKNSRCL